MKKGKLLVAEDVSKRFGETLALDSVSFNLCPGEVHALMGENGAGKSTLGKLFAGIHQPDGGRICMDGDALTLENPGAAKAKGISIVLQEFNLLPDLSVAENLFLANKAYYKAGFLLDKKKMYRHSGELLHLFELGASLDPYELVKNLSIAQMQMLEILKAVDADSRVIILDEPTAALSQNEVKQLFAIINRLKEEKKVGFIIVSHRIEEIFEIADRVTVLRDGKLIVDGEDIHGFTENALVKSMVGREVKDLYGSREFGTNAGKDVAFEVRNIKDASGYLKDISFKIRKGEIVGLTGLVGAGRTELARCTFGIAPKSGGTVLVEGREIHPLTIRNTIRAGIAYVPEDRKHDGLILTASIGANLSLARQNMQKGFVIDKGMEKSNAVKMERDLRIKMGSSYHACNSLSGGNQQKVLLGKWMLMEPRVLIVDEPTRGIDISAKSEIYAILNRLAREGVAILMISSEQPEVIGMCDRVLIMRDGMLAGELEHSEVSEQLITRIATIG